MPELVVGYRIKSVLSEEVGGEGSQLQKESLVGIAHQSVFLNHLGKVSQQGLFVQRKDLVPEL